MNNKIAELQLVADELETNLVNTLNECKAFFLSHGYNPEELAEWLCEIVNDTIIGRAKK